MDHPLRTKTPYEKKLEDYSAKQRF